VNFLLDTNIVSEWVKPHPKSGVAAWLAEADEDRVFVSVITLAEVRYGVERLAASTRRKRLNEWLEEELPLRFEGRILNVDSKIADACGRTIARAEALGRRIDAMDALLAATAEAHDLILVTRNVSDFDPVLKTMINPWQ